MEQTSFRHEATILDYGRVIKRYRWMIAGLFVVSVLVTGVVSKYVSPKLYEAKATLFPTLQELSGGGISFGGDQTKGGGGGGGGGGAVSIMESFTGRKSGPNIMEVLHAILVSRRMAEVVISQLNLMEYYGTTSQTVAINALRGETDVRPSPFKTYEVTVLTRDPKMAADIANAYVSNLDRLNKELNITAAKRNRLFIEARLEEKARKLAEAENALKAFQTEHRTLVLTEQAVAAMTGAANIQGQIVGLEVELAALKEYATPSHPLINTLQVQIRQLRDELDRMDQNQIQAIGTKLGAKSVRSSKLFPSFEEAPALALGLLRLTRQVKIEESVYGMLVGMLEQAKIAETKDVPAIQVLDVAVPSDVRSRPKTLENILVASALSLILGLLLAFFLDYLERLRVQEAHRMRQASLAMPDSAVPAPSELQIASGGNGGDAEPLPHGATLPAAYRERRSEPTTF